MFDGLALTVGEVEERVDDSLVVLIAALQPVKGVVPGGWVGRAARCQRGLVLSARPPAEPDLMFPDYPALQ
jgi:hypothetical protein